MDLSAFQFGVFSPFPRIVPVLNGDPTAFNGMCNREAFDSVNLPNFEESIMVLAGEYIKTKKK